MKKYHHKPIRVSQIKHPWIVEEREVIPVREVKQQLMKKGPLDI